MLLALIFTAQAYALGPIPNGTYKGTETCNGMAPRVGEIVVTDNAMIWDGQKNSFEVDANGFFNMKSVTGEKGNGMGHFTKDGLHYEARFLFKKGKKSVWAPGEDTFSYQNGVLSLEASASAGAMGKIECNGSFKN